MSTFIHKKNAEFTGVILYHLHHRLLTAGR